MITHPTIKNQIQKPKKKKGTKIKACQRCEQGFLLEDIERQLVSAFKG